MDATTFKFEVGADHLRQERGVRGGEGSEDDERQRRGTILPVDISAVDWGWLLPPCLLPSVRMRGFSFCETHPRETLTCQAHKAKAKAKISELLPPFREKYFGHNIMKGDRRRRGRFRARKQDKTGGPRRQSLLLHTPRWTTPVRHGFRRA